MSSISQIRAALKTTIAAAIPALAVYDRVPESLSILPAVVIVPTASDFAVAMGRGVDAHEFDVFVLVTRSDDGLAQTALDTYITGAGSSSVRQAIFQNRSLGLSDCDAHVFGMASYGASWEFAAIDHIGAALKVRVHTSGTA